MRIKLPFRSFWPLWLASLVLLLSLGRALSPAATPAALPASEAQPAPTRLPLSDRGGARLSLVPRSSDPGPSLKVYDVSQGKAREMALEEYLVGVVAAEMPADFELEALKAQAVAARTYTVCKLRSQGGGGCSRHKGSDICTDSGHCQAYSSQAKLLRQWGGSGELNLSKIRSAVEATAGQVITYQGEPINAMFHSTSGGHTEDVEAVYAQALPYLRGVPSQGEEDAPKYHSTARFSVAQVNRALKEFPGAQLTSGKLDQQIEILGRTQSGRVTQVRVGKATLTGTELRRALALNSSNFTLECNDGQLAFHLTGYGHGVGMSQTGANAMARQGAGYREILCWYYTGVDIQPLSAVSSA